MDEASRSNHAVESYDGANAASGGQAYGAGMSALRMARRIAVGVIGSTVVAIGVAMLVLPGPGLVVIPAGLGILGLEFAFARRWLAHMRERAGDIASKVGSSVGVGSSPSSAERKPEEDDRTR